MSKTTTSVATRTNTAVETTQQPDTVKSLLAQPAFQNRFKEVLGKKAQQFMTSLINVANTMPDVEPYSVIQSSMIAAALDLPIDKNLGFAWIVAYKKGGVKYAQFQMGYKGYIQLGLRSGQYQRMNARAINAEAFLGFDEVGEPIFDFHAIDESKEVAGYMFGFKLVNGFVKSAYWTKAKVQTHATQYSQSYKGGFDSPWKSNFDAMALKTVIKNEIAKWGILSIEMTDAITKDSGVVQPDGTVVFSDNEPTAPPPNFGPPPALLGDVVGNPENRVIENEDGDLGPESKTKTPKPEEKPETRAEMAIRIFTDALVPFEDFRDYLKMQNLHPDPSTLDSWDAIPAACLEKMTDKQMSKVLQVWGKKAA